MVRIPFRVLPISPIMNVQDLAALCGNETTEELQPTNPFSEERKVETPLTMALQVLQVFISLTLHAWIQLCKLLLVFYILNWQNE